jgi:hypothetical protein
MQRHFGYGVFQFIFSMGSTSRPTDLSIILSSLNSSSDFTVAKGAPKSTKHLGSYPWSNFFIASTELPVQLYNEQSELI